MGQTKFILTAQARFGALLCVPLLCMAGLAAGCAGPSKISLTPVYVDVQRLAEAHRPEWRDVSLLDREIARLRAEPGALPPAPAAQAFPTLNIPPPAPPTLTVVQPDITALNAAVAASTPSLSAIRAELEQQALADEQLYRHKQIRKMSFGEQNQVQKLEDEYAGSRRAILLKYEGPVINLEAQNAVLADWVASATPTSYSSPRAKQFYADLQKKWLAGRAGVIAVLDQQNKELAKSDDLLAAELGKVRADFRSAIAAEVGKYRHDLDQQIDREVEAARQDAAAEAAERMALFAHTFRDPLTPRLAQAAPQIPLPSPESGIRHSNDSPAAAAARAAIQAQLDELNGQRRNLAAQIVADTRSWLNAAAARQNLAPLTNPAPGVPDDTNRFAAWLAQRRLGPA